MIDEDLLKFVKEELDHMTNQNDPAYNADVEKRVYAQTVKLSEEVGELSEAILAKYNNQRRSKSKDFDVDKEMADVIIVILILAQHLKVDINQALRGKIDKMVARRDVS